jgi:hypothetical protein
VGRLAWAWPEKKGELYICFISFQNDIKLALIQK